MNEDYKLSKELISIMDEASDMASSYTTTSISVESIVYFIAKRYTEAKFKKDIECDVLLPIFKGIPIENQKGLVNDLEYAALEYCKQNIYPDPNLYNSKMIILSDELDRAIRRAKIEMSLLNQKQRR